MKGTPKLSMDTSSMRTKVIKKEKPKNPSIPVKSSRINFSTRNIFMRLKSGIVKDARRDAETMMRSKGLNLSLIHI